MTASRPLDFAGALPLIFVGVHLDEQAADLGEALFLTATQSTASCIAENSDVATTTFAERCAEYCRNCRVTTEPIRPQGGLKLGLQFHTFHRGPVLALHLQDPKTVQKTDFRG